MTVITPEFVSIKESSSGGGDCFIQERNSMESKEKRTDSYELLLLTILLSWMLIIVMDINH